MGKKVSDVPSEWELEQIVRVGYIYPLAPPTSGVSPSMSPPRGVPPGVVYLLFCFLHQVIID